MRSTLPLYILLLCLLPLQPSAAPGAGPTYFTKPENNAQTSPVASTSTSNSSGPNCTDLSSSTGATHPSCWDTLGMFEWMFNWSLSNKTCEQGEIWSTCFLRLAYGGARYECATLGSENCTAPELGGPVTDPRVFYGAFNIYAVNQYFSTWSTALYALKSQSAITSLADILGADGTPGLPRLTPSSLLAAVVSKYGLDSAVDETLVSILPSGSGVASLDTSATYYSTQLATLLGQVLQSLMGGTSMLLFLFLARGGEMMAYTGESLQRLEATLAGELVASVSELEEDP